MTNCGLRISELFFLNRKKHPVQLLNVRMACHSCDMQTCDSLFRLCYGRRKLFHYAQQFGTGATSMPELLMMGLCNFALRIKSIDITTLLTTYINICICLASYGTVTFLFPFHVMAKSSLLTCKNTFVAQYINQSTVSEMHFNSTSLAKCLFET